MEDMCDALALDLHPSHSTCLQIMPTECELTARYEEWNAAHGSGCDSKQGEGGRRAARYGMMYV